MHIEHSEDIYLLSARYIFISGRELYYTDILTGLKNVFGLVHISGTVDYASIISSSRFARRLEIAPASMNTSK